MYTLLIIVFATVHHSGNVEKMEFKTKVACEKAAEFYTRNPYPAMKSEAICIKD